MRSALEKAREAPSSTKARILAAAEHVFAVKGFAGASTREIAARARVNISSLHYHWESKETLYFAVFQNIYDRILDLVRDAIPPRLD
ncbi:MAG: TetR/AcrR family transcriptional regulator, partial [Candidatus Binatia bacterium]